VLFLHALALAMGLLQDFDEGVGVVAVDVLFDFFEAVAEVGEGVGEGGGVGEADVAPDFGAAGGEAGHVAEAARGDLPGFGMKDRGFAGLLHERDGKHVGQVADGGD